MDHPSFNIGISQLITPSNEQIFESEHSNLTKQRSKSLHATTLMANRTSTKRKLKTEWGHHLKQRMQKLKRKGVERLPLPFSDQHYPWYVFLLLLILDIVEK